RYFSTCSVPYREEKLAKYSLTPLGKTGKWRCARFEELNVRSSVKATLPPIAASACPSSAMTPARSDSCETAGPVTNPSGRRTCNPLNFSGRDDRRLGIPRQPQRFGGLHRRHGERAVDPVNAAGYHHAVQPTFYPAVKSALAVVGVTAVRV